MPDPIPVYKTTIYNSNFSGGTDGCSLNTQGGAAGSLSTSNNALNHSLTNGGTEDWHAQLIKNNIPFEQNGKYRISFKIKAEDDRGASFNAGKASDPWNSYSGYNGISLSVNEAQFVFSFTMNNPTDLAARLAFNLGKNTSGVTLTDVKVEKLKFTITALDEITLRRQLNYYPNPVSSVLYIDELNQYQFAELYDINGRSVTQMNVDATSTSFDMESYSRGIYVLRLYGNGIEERIKIMKK